MANQRIEKNFYTRDVLELAPTLLGKLLVRSFPCETSRSYTITETEAYRGEEDLACHASRGRTPRTGVMYSEGGVLYVYLVYGIHWMLNIVTGHEGDPQAVLIRGVRETAEKRDQEGGKQFLQAAGYFSACSQAPAASTGPGATGDPGAAREAVRKEINGPGRLTKALGIDGSFNGEPLYTSQRIWLEDTGITLPHTTTPRIGINYAGEPWKSKPWRFLATK